MARLVDSGIIRCRRLLCGVDGVFGAKLEVGQSCKRDPVRSLSVILVVINAIFPIIKKLNYIRYRIKEKHLQVCSTEHIA
jgi:hypothetical protein